MLVLDDRKAASGLVEHARRDVDRCRRICADLRHALLVCRHRATASHGPGGARRGSPSTPAPMAYSSWPSEFSSTLGKLTRSSPRQSRACLAHVDDRGPIGVGGLRSRDVVTKPPSITGPMGVVCASHRRMRDRPRGGVGHEQAMPKAVTPCAIFPTRPRCGCSAPWHRSAARGGPGPPRLAF